MSEDVEQVAGHVPIRSAAIVDLGLLRLRISSNVPDFEGWSYFARVRPDDGTPVEFELVCIDLRYDDVDAEAAARLGDRTFRGDRFRSGFYLTHHFGPPAHLVTRGRRTHVFGEELHRTVWPYFVKHYLTAHSVDAGLLHLKAAGFVLDGHATLLVGRGSGGKTVFLSEACRAGAAFLTNTHVLVDGLTAHGVASSIRIRGGAAFADVIERGGLRPHLAQGEFHARPEELFTAGTCDAATIRHVCVVDHRPDQPPRFEQVDGAFMRSVLAQFALAVPTYGLKDDVLAHLDGDLFAAADAYRDMLRRTESLLRGCRLHYANVDMLDPACRDSVLAQLAA